MTRNDLPCSWRGISGRTPERAFDHVFEVSHWPCLLYFLLGVTIQSKDSLVSVSTKLLVQALLRWAKVHEILPWRIHQGFKFQKHYMQSCCIRIGGVGGHILTAISTESFKKYIIILEEIFTESELWQFLFISNAEQTSWSVCSQTILTFKYDAHIKNVTIPLCANSQSFHFNHHTKCCLAPQQRQRVTLYCREIVCLNCDTMEELPFCRVFLHSLRQAVFLASWIIVISCPVLRDPGLSR